MRQQSTIPGKGLLGVVAACCCVLAMPSLGTAKHAPTLGKLRADDAALAAKSRSAVLGLYSLDVRLATAKRHLFAVELEARRLHNQRASIDLQLREARLDTRLSLDRLASRVRFLYDHGSPSTLELVLGARSIGDAMTQLDDFHRVTSANQDVLLQVQTARTHLTRLSRALALRTTSIDAAKQELARTVTDLGRAEAARSAYIASLTQRRALNQAQIARLSAQAQAAQALTQQLTQSRATATIAPSKLTTTPAASSVGARTLTVSTTGYDLPGTTSTGLPVGWGVVAVDPSVIPLGTHLTIPGYGEAIAADTGSAVRGAMIDLWFPSLAQASAWGRRSVTVTFHP